jgi:hypothetical protein
MAKQRESSLEVIINNKSMSYFHIQEKGVTTTTKEVVSNLE